MKRDRGFTLIELIVVIFIIALLIGLGVLIRRDGKIRGETQGIIQGQMEALGYPNTFDNLAEGTIVRVAGITEVDGTRYVFIQDIRTAASQKPRIYSLEKDYAVEAGKIYVIKKEFMLPPMPNGTCLSRKILTLLTDTPVSKVSQ